MVWLRRLPSTCVDSFGILERSHVTISLMIFRVILFFWLITFCINRPFASAYIFIEDISSIGSLKGLLKEKLTDNNIEVLGYTPKSLNLVLNKTNQLQTSMVWILRESFESEALIMSRCGQFEQNKYIDGLISNLENKKSKVPRLHIGWIPYKKLGQITSQCVLMEVPQTYDLASLATELAELFKSQNEPLSEDLNEKSVVTNDVLKSANRNEIQNSKKIPMQWGQFRTADSQSMSNSTSQSIQRISYDPDEDLFLTPFVTTGLDNKKSDFDETLKILGDSNLQLSKPISVVSSSGLTENKFTRSAKNSSRPTTILTTAMNSNTASKVQSIIRTSFQTRPAEALIQSEHDESVKIPSVITPSIQRSNVKTTLKSDMKSNLASLKELYLSTNSDIPKKINSPTMGNIIQKRSTKFQNQNLNLNEQIEKTDLNNKNLIKKLKSNFRRELLDKFRKGKGRQAPEWLFEE